jgi:hypothetical protein
MVVAELLMKTTARTVRDDRVLPYTRGLSLQATSLPFIVIATQIGVLTGLMAPVTGLMAPLTAAALVCAGLLSVLIFPAVAFAPLRHLGGSDLESSRRPGRTRERTQTRIDE